MDNEFTTAENKKRTAERSFAYCRKKCFITIAASAVMTVALVLLRVFVIPSDEPLFMLLLTDLLAAFMFFTGFVTALNLRRDFLVRIDGEGIRYWKGFRLRFFPWEWLSEPELKSGYSGEYLALYYNEIGLEENNRFGGRNGNYRHICDSVPVGFADDPDKIAACVRRMNPHPKRKVTEEEQRLRNRAEVREWVIYGIVVAAFVISLIADAFSENEDYLVLGKFITFVGVVITVALIQIPVVAVHRKIWYRSDVRPVPAFIISAASVYLICAAILLAADRFCGSDSINSPIFQWFVYDIFVNFKFIPTKGGSLASMDALLLLEPAIYCYISGSCASIFCSTRRGAIMIQIVSVAVLLLMFAPSIWFLSDVLTYI